MIFLDRSAPRWPRLTRNHTLRYTETVRVRSVNILVRCMGAGVLAACSFTGACGVEAPEAPAIAPPQTNSSPRAIASPGGTFIIGHEVVLDGSASFDPNGDPLIYTWSRVAAPPESADFEPRDTEVTSFSFDALGSYEFLLTVSDGFGASATSTVVVSAVPHGAMVVNAGGDANVPWMQPFSFNGIADLKDATSVELSWNILSAPSGSLATLQGADSISPAFTPDLIGLYVVEFQARSPWASVRDEVRIFTHADQTILALRASEARYSKSTDRLIYQYGPSLRPIFIADLSGGGEVELPLYRTGSFELSPDGSKIAVGHLTPVGVAGWDQVSIVDVGTASVTHEFVDVGSTPHFDTEERVMVTDSTEVVKLDLAANSVSGPPRTFPFESHRLAKTGAGMVHGFTNPLQGEVIGTFDLSSFPFNDVLPSADNVVSVCDALWPAADGSFVVTGCGDVLRVTGNALTHLTVQSTLPVVDALHVSHAPGIGRIAVVQGTSGARTVEFFDDLTFTSQGSLSIPLVQQSMDVSVYSSIDPLWAFFSADESEVIVVGHFYDSAGWRTAVVRVSL